MKILDVLNAPWAIEPAKLAEITNLYATHLRGEKIDIKAVEAQLGRPLHNDPPPYTVEQGVAIITLEGVIAKRMNLFTRMSGGVSTEIVGRDLRAALADPSVHAVLLDIDSPGGTVDGTQTLANQVYAARDGKPIVAFANGDMCSGACWIGTAAREVYIAGDTTFTGSIGVAMRHMDVSRAEEKAGIKTTEIFAGKYKRIASDYAPLSDEGRATLQAMVDHIYSVFVNDVARNRGVGTDAVLRDMADGRVFLGRSAIAAGLVDGVSTREALIADLVSGRKGTQRAGAAAGAP